MLPDEVEAAPDCINGPTATDISDAKEKSYNGVLIQENEDEPTGLFFYDCYFNLKKKFFPEHVKIEAKALLSLGWGLCLNLFLSFFIPVSSVLIVGHKGKEFLAAIGLSFSVCNVTGNVFVAGFTSTCETLCSQAYGAGHFKRYGILIQRAFFITILAVLPSCALWINMDKLLLFLGQDEKVSLMAGQFTICYIPGLFFFILFCLLTRFLACQSNIRPAVYGTLVAFVVNGILCYIFVYTCDFGIRGAAFALDLAYFSYSAFLLAYIYRKKIHHKTWHGWSSESLDHWKEFIYFAVPTMLMVIIEWVVYELAIITFGTIGSLQQAALVSLFYFAGSIYYVSFGISIGTAVRVGNFLGAGQPKQAKNCLRVSVMLSALFTFMIGLLVSALKDVIGYLFTNDSAVLELISFSMPIAALYQLFDGVQTVMSGAVRGVGYQKFGALVSFVGYVCIGIPLYLLFILKAGMGIPGFWTGALTGISFQIVGLSFLLFRADWNELSHQARQRSGVAVDVSPFENDDKVQSESYGATVVAINERQKMISDNDATETSFSNGSNGHNFEDSRGIEPSDNDDPLEDSIVSDNFFVSTRSSHTKCDVFIKVSIISILLLSVVISAVLRMVYD